jgi:hypothetical protein
MISDFILKPLNIKTKEGPATWHADTEPLVHDLIDNLRDEAVEYTRVRIFDGKYQDCKVIRESYEKDPIFLGGPDGNIGVKIIMLPGDGSRYLVSRISTNNKIKDEKAENDNQCVICFEYIKNHVGIPCGHVITCTRCSKELEKNENRCPLCRVKCNKIMRIFQ